MPVTINGNGTITGVAYGNANFGRVLQTVNTVKTDQFSLASSSTPTLVTGLSLNITPTSNTSLILVLAGINLGNDNGSGQYTWRVDRSSTQISQQFMNDVGDEDFFRTIVLLDNPGTTSSTNYNVKVWSPNAVGTVYVNQSGTTQRSHLTLMEIAG